ncbi:MAG: hypothetical protein HOQ46_05325 [Saccharothrix sp.]|nr:hypothetical protein [Saccharothrix sp.]
MLSAILLAITALTTSGIGTGQAAAKPISEVPISTAQLGENCANIGNGDVCIRIGDRYNGGHADITVWYDKHAGDPVTIRLRFSGSGGGYDEGAFTISAGEVRGYIWRNVYLYDYCHYGQIMTGPPPNYTPIVTGGYVCI